MGITISNKQVSTTQISCGGSFQVTFSLTAEPDITENPTDIVLILDRSGSMAGSAIANLKNGAKAFIDIIDSATDGTQDGQIGNGSRIGIVSFATTATQDTQLITSVTDLKAAVDALTADGSTNHADAFTQALELFDLTSTNAKVMVMFTDGFTTAGPNPTPITTAIKAQGITIYVIGLSGNGGIDVQALNDWSSDPDSAFVAITPDDSELEDLFEDLAENIVNPGATNIVLTDQISSCFRITSVSMPTKGTASLIDSNTVRWNIDELGVSTSEGAALIFTVQHNGVCSGSIPVNASVTYTDDQGNIVNFPNPEVEADCDIVIIPEGCPVPVDVSVEGCSDSIEFNAGDLSLDSLGRIVQLDVTLLNICPNRRVALAITLNEVDDEGNEYKRGFKTLTVPAHTSNSCRDVTIRCVKFVLPESLDVSNTPTSMCNTRNFVARCFANYIDYDFECCTEDNA